jgi:hypothetical protein
VKGSAAMPNASSIDENRHDRQKDFCIVRLLVWSTGDMGGEID